MKPTCMNCGRADTCAYVAQICSEYKPEYGVEQLVEHCLHCADRYSCCETNDKCYDWVMYYHGSAELDQLEMNDDLNNELHLWTKDNKRRLELSFPRYYGGDAS